MADPAVAACAQCFALKLRDVACTQCGCTDNAVGMTVWEDGREVRTAVCPACGSEDVDVSFSDEPLKDGVKCWDCKTIYPLTAEGGRRIEP